jgi:hypothetical protein
VKVCRIDGCGGKLKVIDEQLCGKHYARYKRHGDPLGGRTEPGVPLAYMERQLLRDDNECFIWPYANDGKGYGIIWLNSRNAYVHRVSCERSNGPPSIEKPIARHLCGNGNKGCFNPKHLIWSDQVENMADTIIHGTSNRGERQGSSKLKETDVLKIYHSTKPRKELAIEFGVSVENIYQIKNGKSWSWLTKHPVYLKKKGGS